ncbi:MAG: 50S ribosomal protein L9 [Rhodospirillales bacterium]|nr:50S ribosomal protein L9 [Rhodospirillales bacterium]MCB9979560.1 50S ribosomal protein L9 [Rhodospirillales bacterium]
MGSTQVILLERVESLGNMGDTVNVKLGYARNYLLPQRKALRATKDNIAHFEAQKASLEAENKKKREAAEKESKKLEGLSLSIIRQSSEGGQLYGSVAARDIAEVATAESGVTVGRSQVELNQSFKTIGLFPVVIALHPEVKVEVTVNIARSAEEAAIQKKTGKAMIAGAAEEEKAAPAAESSAQEAEAPAAETVEDAE